MCTYTVHMEITTLAKKGLISKRENKSSGVDCRTRLEDRVVLALVESALVLEAVVVLGLVSVYRLSVRSQLELTTALASPTLVLAPP